MRRIASHYIYWRQFYRMHYVELDESGILTGVFPLEGEIAGTEFYDGILILVPIPALDARLKGNKRYYLILRNVDRKDEAFIEKEQFVIDILGFKLF